MGVEVACACGERAATKRCGACALRYCAACSAARHAKGAFQRHAVEDVVHADDQHKEGETPTTNANGTNSPTSTASEEVPTLLAESECDECSTRAAVVDCTACELRYCAECANAVHRHGNLKTHTLARCGLRQVFANEIPRQRHVAQVDQLLEDDEDKAPTLALASLASSSSLKHSAPPFFARLDNGDTTNDPDQELSPTPPTKASPASEASSSSSSSYDLWGSWSVSSFRSSSEARSLASPPLSGSADWRAFRSLSIDEAPASPSLARNDDDDETASLHSIATSLRSMSYAASNGEEAEPRRVEKRAIRPRSFSDYTSLGAVKLHDIWNERVPQLMATPTPATMPTPTLAPGEELSRSMQTTVASRHVIVRSHTAAFAPSTLRRLIETLSGYGPLASIREEFASDGVLFCTFFQLKAAIGAVKLWFTNNTRSTGSETSAHFSVPYEAPNDINCATLLLQVHGPPLIGGSNDMRQLCSRYGEVASVLERDADGMGSNPFLVEFNDARDVPTTLSRLAGVLLPSGHMITATRSRPPTFDMAMVQVFQDSVVAMAGQQGQSYTNRPKSFSESTSILTSPSSTSSSSPLQGSFFEPRSTSFRNALDPEADRAADSFNDSAPTSRSTSPFTPSLAASGNAWRVREAARPRSSSAFASLSADASSSLFSDGFASSTTRTTRYQHQYTPSQHRPPASAPTLTNQSHQVIDPHALMQGRLGPIRTGSDPGFRSSYAGSTTSSTSSIGRNDQGTGEYSLAIEKVAAGDDKRTTLMVRNIPNKYTQQMLLAEINAHHHGKYDFFYLPIDFKNKCNMGYAFINFIQADSIVSFYQEFDSQKWTNFNSEKVCAISYARLQGKQAMITRFQNSSLLEKHESYRPLVFYSTGPNQGKPEPFPSPKPQQHQHQHQHQFGAKKPHHHHHHHHHASSHHQMMMNGGEEFFVAAHTSHLYAQQQQQHFHHAAHVLHGHALLANAHAAAAAMLHNLPTLGMPPPQYAPPRSAHFSPAYQQYGGDRRHNQSYVNGVPTRPTNHASFSSGFPPTT